MSKRFMRAALITGSLAAGGLVAFSIARRLASRSWPLPKAIDAELRAYDSHVAGETAYYVDDSAGKRPIVLLHSINAAASAFETKPLFDALRAQRTVIAPDLPGFGASDRSDRVYSRELYCQYITEFLESIAAKYGAPDVVALSLTCELVAHAVQKSPTAARSLTFISPTGFGAPGARNALERVNAGQKSASRQRVLALPFVGPLLYDAIASRASIRYYLGKSFVGPTDPEMVEYAVATSHQPGARHAPLWFLSGALFDPTIRTEVYEQLSVPVQVIYDQDAHVTFGELPKTLARAKGWRATRIAPTRGLPHFEKTEETVSTLESFWGSLDTKPNDNADIARRANHALS